jgi:hypothetical protein
MIGSGKIRAAARAGSQPGKLNIVETEAIRLPIEQSRGRKGEFSDVAAASTARRLGP